MNIFVDQIGHADLSYSIHALFEKRLGYTLYCPLGGDEWTQHGIFTAPLIHPLVTRVN